MRANHACTSREWQCGPVPMAHAQRSRRPGAGAAGFTLVELLVVISIIALLIAILLPSLKKAREQTNMVKCMSNMRSMQLGITYYADDHSQTLPGPLHPPIYRHTNRRAGESQFTAYNKDTQMPWFLLTRIGPYLSKHDQNLEFIDEVSTCPTMARLWPDENFLPNRLAPESEPGQNNPSHSHPYHYLVNSWGTTAPSYYFGWANIGVTWTGWLNTLASNTSAGDPNAVASNSARRPVKMDKVRRTASEWSVGEAWWLKKSVAITPLNIQTTSLGPWQLNEGNSQFPLPRKPIHAGRTATNMVYFDGHAAPWRAKIDDWLKYFPANPNTNHTWFQGNVTAP